MSVRLESEDHRRLVAIVQRIPGFENERDRRRLLELALGGTPRADVVLGTIDLGGPPMLVASGWLQRLADFGQVEYGKEALGVFLNALIPYVDRPTEDYVRGLFLKYPLDVPVAPQPAIDSWKGGPSDADVQEKIIGENTFYHVYLLKLAVDAARAVAHLGVNLEGGGGAYGTGFMIAADLLMTNHHVIRSEDEADRTAFSFDYELSQDGSAGAIRKAKRRKGDLFVTCAELDYSIVKLCEVPEFGAPLKLAGRTLSSGESVTIIGHPLGHFKQISLRNNAVQYADGRVVQYTSSTEPGSSGSPVLGNELFDVVALHHKGGNLVDPSNKVRCFRNQGIASRALLDDLAHRSPDVKRVLEQ